MRAAAAAQVALARTDARADSPCARRAERSVSNATTDAAKPAGCMDQRAMPVGQLEAVGGEWGVSTTGRPQAHASSTLFLIPTPERIGAIDTQDRPSTSTIILATLARISMPGCRANTATAGTGSRRR